MALMTLLRLRHWLSAGRATPSVHTQPGIVMRQVPRGQRIIREAWRG